MTGLDGKMYRCVWTNSAGSTNSNGASLTLSTQPADPGNPTSNSPNCTNVTLTRTGTPPSGETWYWQTVSMGTATTSSGLTYTATTSGTYYIRSRNNTTGCWSAGEGSLSITVVSGTGTWVGKTSTDWNTGSNWCGGSVPNGIAVSIPGGLTNYPVISSSVSSVKTITINNSGSGASLEVVNGGSITLSDALTVNSNGTLKVDNGGSLTATATVPVMNGGTINCSGTLDFSSAGGHDINSGSGTINLSNGAITVHDIKATGITVNISGGTLSVHNTAAIYTATGGLIEIQSGGTITSSSWSATGGAVDYLGNSTIAALTYYNLSVGVSGGACKLNGTTTVNGNLTLKSSSTKFDLNGKTANVNTFTQGVTNQPAGTYTSSNDGTWLTGTGSIVVNAGNKESVSTGNWNTSGTWTPSGVPIATDHVTIKSTHTVSVDIINAVSNNLNIETGAVLEISTGKALTINGSLSNGAGDGGLIVRSGGSLITKGSVSGTATVERYIAGAADWTGATTGWHLLSSPVAAQAISTAFTVSPADQFDFYAWNEPTADWVNYKNSTVAPTWSDVNGTSFVPGKGYMVAYKSNDTKLFTGTLNSGNVTNVPLTESIGGADAVLAGWNLLGNPYPSGLKWNDGNWSLPSGVGGVAKIWSGSGYTDISASGLIPACNGFMILLSTGLSLPQSTTLTIPEATRSHGGTWYNSGDTYIKLMARESESNTEQECNIRLNEKATDTWDLAYDSRFLAGFGPQLYSIVGKEKFSTNSLPNLDNNRVIELGFVKNEATSYTLELNMDKLIPNINVYLTDKKAGTEIKLNNTPVYNFTAAAGDIENRFSLRFQNTTGLPPGINKENIHAYVAGNILHISQSVQQSGKVYLYNVTGQLLRMSNMLASPTQNITLPALTPGVYVISIRTGLGSYNQKVVISNQ